MDPIQNPLFNEPIGSQFRSKRQQLGLGIEDVARSLRFSAHLVEAIESEQWGKLGAAVYAKSYVSSYARLLGLNPALLEEIPSLSSQAPALKTLSTIKVESGSAASKWLLGLLTALGLAAILAYFGLRQDTQEPLALDALVSTPAPAQTAVAAKPEAVGGMAAQPTASDSAVMPADAAADAALPTPASVPADAGVSISVAQDCWTEILGADGGILFKGMLVPGQTLQHPLDKVGRITLGNAGSATVKVNGAVQDIAPLVKGSVARFQFDADGRPAALTP